MFHKFMFLCLTLWCLGTLAFATVPSITSFTPASGPIGTVVTVNGHYLAAVPTAAVNGTSAVVDVTAITVTIAAGSTTGRITVTTPGGTATSATNFIVYSSPPTITPIGNQTINFLNTATAALPFSVGDALTPAASLTVTATSSNLTLFPVIRIVLGGAGAARTVTVTPAAGQSGTGTITLTVTDGGGLTATTSFTVTVNGLPTISAITNQVINMGMATSALPFTVGDDLTAVNALTVTGVSSNTALVKTTGIVLTGPDAQGLCSVTVTPVAAYSGVTTIRLTVTDGSGQSASSSFTLTVNRPTITSIANQTINMNSATSALAFTVGDNMTPVASLTMTGASNNYALVPNANIVFGGAGATRTVKVTPLTGKYGIVTITLTVRDDAGLTALTSFTVTVVTGTSQNSTDSADMVWAPAGTFTMGSAYYALGVPVPTPATQQVTLTGYWIYKNPVTVAQYRAFCTATQHALPPFPTGSNGGYSWANYSDWTAAALQQHPIVNVAWADAKAYAVWAGVTLATEAQYEYAARGPQGYNYPWGGTATSADPNNGWDVTKCANLNNSVNVGKSTWPVGSFPAGASWCGAQDMTGNVSEWCADWYGDFSPTPVSNPTGPSSGPGRLLKGGNWSWSNSDSFRNVGRGYVDPSSFSYGWGFRCVSLAPGP